MTSTKRKTAVRRSSVSPIRLGGERAVGVVTIAVSVLAVAPGLQEPFVVVKQTGLVAGAAVLVAMWSWRSADDRRVLVPRSLALVLGALVFAVMVATSLAAGHLGRSFFGEYARSAGLLQYGSALLLLAALLRAFDRRSVRLLARSLVAIGGVVVLVGALQAVGVDVIDSGEGTSDVVGTLGQPNFIAGFVAVLAPLFLWIAADRETDTSWRVTGGVALLLSALVSVRAASFQVLPAAVVGLAVAAPFVALTRCPAALVRRALIGACVVAAVLAVALSGFVQQQIRDGMEERRAFWSAAGEMIEASPVIGNGLSGFATSFAAERPRNHALEHGAFQLADAPHNVPLGMAVAGGMLLLAAYLAFVGFVGWRLVRGLRTSVGSDRALLGAFGGAWVAYQVQSLVSIDFPALVVAHVATAAGVLLLADDTPLRSVELGSSGGRRARSLNGLRIAGVAVALALAWIGLRPLLAEAAFTSAEKREATAASDADLRSAIEDFRTAAKRAPWNGRYWAELAAVLVRTGDQDGALDAGAKAVSSAPEAVGYAVSAGQLAHRVGQDDAARRYFEQALDGGGDAIDTVLFASSAFFVDVGETERGVELAEEGFAVSAQSVQDHVILADVYDAAGRTGDADEVWRTILELSPDHPRGLERFGLVDE